ncbi:MAG: hypothetical protein LBB67_07660 [Oscillospiraceae bacterium]|jgi:hypothetical protein|nr:hypothetical protein [Oscillospiraceae bacterium]
MRIGQGKSVGPLLAAFVLGLLLAAVVPSVAVFVLVLVIFCALVILIRLLRC